MGRRTLITLALVLMLGGATPHGQDRSDARAQVEFGIEVARRGLWKEALYRWQRAIEIDPTYAAAWSNLGIAFEIEGRFDEAREAYETALHLDPSNLHIEQNYDLFLEVNDRVRQNSR